MREPTNSDHARVHARMENDGVRWAWPKLYDIMSDDTLKGWRMFQVMMAFAPGRNTLGAIAAGPLEDMIGLEVLKPLIWQEAERNPRFRVCLGLIHGLPKELERFADFESHLPPPPATDFEAKAEEIALMTAWFHHSDTMWAPSRFRKLCWEQPDEGLFLLKLLLASNEYPHVRESVFIHAFDFFVHVNGATHLKELKTLIKLYPDLHEWCLKAPRYKGILTAGT